MYKSLCQYLLITVIVLGAFGGSNFLFARGDRGSSEKPMLYDEFRGPNRPAYSYDSYYYYQPKSKGSYNNPQNYYYDNENGNVYYYGGPNRR